MPAESNRRLGIPGIAQISEGRGGLPRIKIDLPHVHGEMYLHGAHVTSWKPDGNDEVIFLSSKSHWQHGQAIRGGIPICFPWFRGKADDPHAPAHGFARTRMWQIESVVQNNKDVTVCMFIESDEQTRRWWPGEFRLVHRVTFGSVLTLEMICSNTGTASFRFEEALHTYNRVSDIQQIRVRGLEALHFLDNTDSNQEKRQRGDVVITSQTDNAYVHAEGAVDLIDQVLQRRIRLQKNNSRNTVVWNPWEKGTAVIRDLGNDEWNQFLCIEASNIRDFAITLAPGQEHKMTAVLSVAKL